eukprot:scaffold41399_cov62-Phaeocystis_antarctica.AAC.1
MKALVQQAPAITTLALATHSMASGLGPTNTTAQGAPWTIAAALLCLLLLAVTKATVHFAHRRWPHATAHKPPAPAQEPPRVEDASPSPPPSPAPCAPPGHSEGVDTGAPNGAATKEPTEAKPLAMQRARTTQ